MLQTLFLELWLDVKVTVTQKKNCDTIDPKMYPHPNFWIPILKNNVGDLLPIRFLST